MKAEVSFDEKMKSGHIDVETIERILKKRFCDIYYVEPASLRNDLRGADLIAYSNQPEQPEILIDVKTRAVDFRALRGEKCDDLALETWSDVQRKKVGWTRDTHKITDYVIWYWKDTGRFHIEEYRPLRKIFRRFWEEWRNIYRVETQTTRQNGREWQSECVFVPTCIVEKAKQQWANGFVRQIADAQRQACQDAVSGPSGSLAAA